jgi:hypothetical protein
MRGLMMLILLGLSACAAGDWSFLNGAASQIAGVAAPPTQDELAAGIKEALATGTERAVRRIGRTDGFWQNAALRIPLPDSLKKAGKTMRSLGQGKTVDEFHLSLNRAAEQAVPEAAAIFGAAIRDMSLADAQRILNGPSDAATAYFRSNTSAALTARFRPVVARATAAVGATRRYKELSGKVGRYASGFQMQDLDGYITERALAGVFSTLAEEEKKIRTDPAARTTELLRRVFGR